MKKQAGASRERGEEQHADMCTGTASYCTSSATEMNKAASALRGLVKHCVSSGSCEEQRVLLKQIAASESFKAAKFKDCRVDSAARR